MISRIKGLIASSMQLSTNNTASPAMAGDVAYWDGSRVKTTPLSKWDASLGTPVGVVVVPEGFAPDGKARIIGLKSVDKNGNQSSSHVSMKWGVTGDTSLTNFNRVPTTDNNGSTSTGSNGIGYLPSDNFTGATSFVDPKAKYRKTSNLIPSPYLGDVPNPEYNKEISGYNNALSDFNGLSNTETLVGLGTGYTPANAAYKYNDGASNLQWYLPAMGELGYLMLRFNEINSVITALGGVAVSESYGFWSSSEYSSLYAYSLDTYNGYVDYYGKNYYDCVRPFAILDDGEDSGGGSNLTFPVTLIEGDNGQLGIDVYNYILEKYSENIGLTEELYFKGTSYSAFDGRIIGIISRGDNRFILNLQNNLGAATLTLCSNGEVILNIFG